MVNLLVSALRTPVIAGDGQVKIHISCINICRRKNQLFIKI